MMIKAIAFAAALASAAIGAGAMEQDAFTEAMREARSNNPHQEIARLRLLIAGGELTDDQQVEALSRIALNYATTADDKPAAVAAYEEVIAAAPDTGWAYWRPSGATMPISSSAISAGGSRPGRSQQRTCVRTANGTG